MQRSLDLRIRLTNARMFPQIYSFRSGTFPEMSKYIPEGGLDPATFQNVMDAANIKYYLAKVT